MRTARHLFPILLLVVQACDRGENSLSMPHNVFGRDDRVAITSRVYPWSAIGYLDMGCTGTLVGRDWVLTAAHCVTDEATGLKITRPVTFRPNYINGTSEDYASSTEIVVEAYSPGQSRNDDWALLHLSKPLGDRYGFMDVESVARDAYDAMSVNLAGYSGDFQGGITAGVHQDCRIRRDAGYLLFHDCDMTRGASGGPVFRVVNGRGKIVGVNVSEYRNGETSQKVTDYSESVSNQAVPSRTFAARVAQLMGQAPQNPPPQNPPPQNPGAPHVEETVEFPGYASLKMVRTNGDIGVKAGYEACYEQMRRYVQITERSWSFPYSIDIFGTADAMIRMVDELSCVDRVYEVAGDDLKLLHDKSEPLINGYVGLKLVYTGSRIDVKDAYQPCYTEMSRRVQITETSYMFPYSINVRAPRASLMRLGELGCIEDVYEKTAANELIPLSRK